jgi:2-C-methyl-D-erythritol 4-phosphate cytidylyltransferase/2-C-methyl-D-erythritol 4-phosphate cytidylyltransferase/2-C-methyl-D-erythritol 2,4-cyclodiphosphate synthase
MNAPFAAIVTAAGSSARMRAGLGTTAGAGAVPAAETTAEAVLKKEYLPLGPDCRDAEGRPLTVLGAAVSAFAGIKEIGLIVVTVPAGAEAPARAALPRYLRDRPSGPVVAPAGGPPVFFTAGGPTRSSSVYRALSFLDSCNTCEAPAWVLIHDGARPWVGADLIRRVMEAALRRSAVIPLTPLLETPKEIGPGGFILKHLRRSNLGLAQTPQAFAFPRILRAHEQAAAREAEGGWEYTDDAEIWGEFCGPVATVPGERGNRKITYREDLG